MKRILLAATLAACTTTAFAQVNIGSGTQANSEAAAAAKQQQGLINNPVNVIEAAPIPSDTTARIRNVPSIALGGPASGPCNGFSGGVGAAAAGWGATFNFSKVDEGCEERETARIAALMGRMDIANLVLEEMNVVKRAQERRASNQPKPTPTAAPVKKSEAIPAQPQLVAASTMITPSEQTRAVCDNAKLTGDHILAQRLGCPK